ncbi:type ISP restriction/modification enzyme [Helicobacter pylori]
MKNLYNTFFKVAFKKQSEKLGIVYTPIEVVDFILRATNGILKKHFHTDFNDQSITIFDPFTGTGSFIARLLSKENELISDEALKEKFQKNLFAFDIVLLSYYIALINITQAAQNRDSSLKNFKNIALTDSLDYLEEKNDKGALPLYEDLKENKDIKDTLADQNIRVIIGNPPYSAGAKSENDNNQNLSHPKLEKLVTEKYGKNSTSRNVGKATRDTLIQSIRMASDLLKDKGVVGFVVNGSFIDSKSADGFRKCVAKEFSHLYVLNLRGNQRTSGEVSKKEGGKIFDSGSRATVAVIFFVKDKSVANNTIHYYEVGDYLKREAKLHLLANFENLDSVPFEKITPNDKGDWINQREDAFEKLIPLKRDKKLKIFDTIFDINSGGVATSRDPWVYNFSQKILTQSVQNCIDTYNADLKRFNERFREAFKQRAKSVKSGDLYKQLNDKEITTDKTKIAWTRSLKKEFIKNTNLPESSEKCVRLAMYRPFNKQWLYFDKNLNEEQSQLPKIFPDKSAQNVVINTSSMASRNFSCLIANEITDLQTMANTQAYPLYYYDDLGNRHYAISGYALNLFRRHYKDNAIVEEEIFYYIYAILHHKGYLEKYKNSLAKEAPRIALSEDFKELSMLGKELGELHLNYESGEMHTSVKYTTLMNAGMEGYYDVEKMTKKGDSIIYNQNITITKIPQKAFDYVVNGKSAIDWVIERYQKTMDKDSLIENNPNDYAGGKYIFELLCRVIKLSEKSVDLIEKISEKRFE